MSSVPALVGSATSSRLFHFPIALPRWPCGEASSKAGCVRRWFASSRAPRAVDGSEPEPWRAEGRSRGTALLSAAASGGCGGATTSALLAEHFARARWERQRGQLASVERGVRLAERQRDAARRRVHDHLAGREVADVRTTRVDEVRTARRTDG